MSARYVVRPKADEDLDDQALYLAEQASGEIGHRFLIAAHETFSLLATQPEMGWHPRLKHPALASLMNLCGALSGADEIYPAWYLRPAM